MLDACMSSAGADGCPPVWEVDPTLGKLVVFRR